MPELTFDKVSKSFGDNVVIDKFSATIHDGEFLVLLGPSGCGKSTLLRMLAGLENISSGTISIGDRVVNNVQPKERDIAMRLGHRLAFDQNFAGRGREQPGDHLQQGRLAAAGRADHDKELAFVDLEIQRPQ